MAKLLDSWRRRSSSTYADQAIGSLSDNVKGALGLNLLHEPSEPWVDFIFHSPLRIRDFAQALLANISNSQTLKRNGNAYLSARQDPLYQDVAARIHSFYFLATPHRGADSTGFVKAYLSVSLPSGSKSYVKELLPDSQTVQADHRHICKFRGVTDPNYTALIDCFKTTIEQIERNSATRQHEQMKVIANALDIAQRPANDLLNVEERRHRGTCEWLTTHPGFQSWVSFGNSTDAFSGIGPLDVASVQDHRFFWLNGPPGSGKSVAAGHVIDHLASYNLDCSYFFFHNDSKATVTQLLLSLAFQMAESNFEIRQTFLDFLQHGEELNTQDHTVIWNTIFLGRLFKTSFSQPQYWVIDALDECPKKSLKSLIQKFGKIDPAVPLRIFITSRPDSPDAPLRQLLNEEKIHRFELQTGQTGSMNDIAAYIRSRPRLSKLLSDEGSGTIISDILEKTKGIFLWASLIIARLDELYSIEDIRTALGEVPSEMNGFYGRILESITNSPNAEKARCILKWVVCAPEPLTTEEVKEAVRLDIGHTLIAPASSDIFSEICGSLVTVDKDNNPHVQLMHQTVKEFLTSSASNFYVNQHDSHEQIASICLEHLTGRNGLRRAARRPTGLSSTITNAFTDYASTNFSYHLSHSHSTDPSLLAALVQFITTKSLVWIETISRKGKLSAFIRTIRYLKPYLARQLEKNPPFDKNYQAVSSWINDLTRLVTIFGRALQDCPESIYAFIPPLCPKSSLIHKTFASSSPQKVICAFNENWEERLSCIVFQAAAKSVASSDQYLAVGLANGSVKVFNNSTLEETAVLEHGKPVRQVVFGNVSNVLASLSPKLLTLWDSRQHHMWSIPIGGLAASVSFNNDDSRVFVTLKGEVEHAIMAFKVNNGSRLESLTINSGSTDSMSDSDDSHKGVTRYCPEVICLAPSLSRAATTYRSSHLTVYSFDGTDGLEKLCKIEKKGSETAARPPQILDVVFNPAVESDLMAVAYQSGDIVTIQIDDWSSQQIATYHLHARVLASSADGRTLAAGDNEGEEAVTGIIFASNSLRFYDVRGRSCNIWEPSVLVRKGSVDDNSSDPEENMSAVPEHYEQPVTHLFDDDRAITAMIPAGDEKYLFCAREDGSVTIHDVTTGLLAIELRLHAVDIRHLAWQPRTGLLVSVDTSRRCVGTRLSPAGRDGSGWRRLEQAFSFRASGGVTRALVRPDGLAVLISTEGGEDLWQDNKVVTSKHSMGQSRWMLHPTDQPRLLLCDNDRIHIYRWTGLERETSEAGISLVLPPQIADLVQKPFGNKWLSRADTSVLAQTVRLQSQSGIGFLTLNVDHMQPATTSVVVACTATRSFIPGVKGVLAVSRSNILFLTRAGWICSLGMKAVSEPRYYTRHFFIPPFWRAGGESLIQILSKNSLAMAYRDDLIIVHGYIDFTHKRIL
ncbi:hypothetical protein CONLIGDRAFT_699459 [Coniochaeta ligniaria NRRL 30616]|uniref:Uncharacterized protein n=1 Tax=Coniochaeta ligniaria NRRL 30616 TaxID=1408157 RepID=A0A1J7IZN9_9PEZI|nr:hypothetical protein CONLIGDRAFT_699459 [Coniochaeta ligniaria NRRL 30616]